MTYGKEDDWQIDFLSRIRERPGAFLGSEHVAILAAYMRGYRQARTDVGYEPRDALMQSFQAWLRSRSGNERSTAGWNHLVEQEDSSSKSIWTFFRLLDQFAEEAGIDLTTSRRWPPCE